MQEHETIISGAVPPKKRKKSAAKIVGIILFLLVFGGASYLFVFGKADGLLKKTLAIAAQSWNEVFSPQGDKHISVEMSLDSVATINNEEPSSTADFGQASSSENGYVAPSKAKKSAKKTPKGQTEVTHVSGVAGAAETSLAANNPIQPQASTNETTSSYPITVADTDAEPSSSPITSSVASSSPLKPPQCSISSVAVNNVVPRVVFNEIAWMGSPSTTGETAAKAANREWIELKDVTQTTVDLAGWQIMDSAGNIDVTFGSGDKIEPGEFYLLSRDGDAVRGIESDKAYSGGLSNSGEVLAVFDATCGIADVLDASKGWPGGDNIIKQTLERKVGGTGWQTSLSPGGTPHAENSVGAVQGVAGASTYSSTFAVSVTIAGDGAGKIMSKPTGISCGSIASSTGVSICAAAYKSGTPLTLLATPGSNVMFAGWTGPCSGTGICSFPVDGIISVTAQFRSTPSSMPIDNSAPSILSMDNSSTSTELPDDGEASSTGSPAVSSSTPLSLSTSSGMAENQIASSSEAASVASLNHIVIAQIQIAGVSSANDFVKIYNPTATSIDLSGWKLRKKSSTGTDSSLRDLPKGSTIAPGAYFTWANSSNGFAESIGAEASSTETLSANNSVALSGASGMTVDAIAWGTGTNQYGEGSPYPQNPAASQILARKVSDAVLVDTGNNADDFALQ